MTTTYAPLERRHGYVSPAVNANGTDSVGYICQKDDVRGYRFCSGLSESTALTEWNTDYSEAVRTLRKREREAWGKP